MKNLIFSSFIFLITPLLSVSQIYEYASTISRKDFSRFYVTNNKQDSILLVKNEKGERTLVADKRYKLISGVGWRKDANGNRGNDKEYLVSSAGDTLSVFISGGREIHISDSVVITRKSTSYGWEYYDIFGEKLLDVELYWNDAEWKFKLTFFDENKDVETLRKGILISLVTLASRRSECYCDCPDGDMWLFL